MDEAYELSEYLPIEDISVYDYTNALFQSADVNFEKDKYQFSYFAIL
jgi:hypothetical protein